MARLDFNRIASVYDAGRALSEDAMEPWRLALLRHLPETTSLPAVDVGCGTGHFSAAIARWLWKGIIGIDPSSEMLRAAPRAPGVSYVLGRAEDLPLAGSACDFAWLSTVVHHFDDLPRAAAELRRVLRPGGAVFIRNLFPGRADITLFRYFPRAKEIAESFPTIEMVQESFAGAGFRLQALESVTQLAARGLRDAAERVRLRADTTLQLLTDEEFADGMRALDAEAAAETDPAPITVDLDLLVFR